MIDERLYELNIPACAVTGVAILFNLVVMVVFLASKQLRIKYYFFVFTLALTDTVSAAAFILLNTIKGIFLNALVDTSYSVLRLNFFFVAVTRLMALSITPPGRYDSMVTLGRMVAVYVLMWVVSALINFPLTYADYRFTIRFIQPLISVVILTATAILYVAVFRKIARYLPTVVPTSGISNNDEQTGTHVRQTRHLMITFTLILVTSCLCSLPIGVASFMIYFGSSGSASGVDDEFLVYFQISVVIAVSYSTINPFIYWWRLVEFRKALFHVMCSWRSEQTAISAEASMSMETVIEQAM